MRLLYICEHNHIRYIKTYVLSFFNFFLRILIASRYICASILALYDLFLPSQFIPRNSLTFV